ncbi:putative amidoligase [Leptospira broomii serovar Hurstbridge str. 5399]|uniref:Amidoligase n=1 Tax=Leptospira broomii serovar Hurstbridge str. 5399 TaxID=1049789 RepID=T0GIG2_9LEPT|nr:transglutaminase family protein [Leptospira broomii]EQA45183.1 putative amidoligase [Leptospira broomii serovar Hurstbridge str. 5399]
MSLLVSLTHETSYEYDKAVSLSPHVIRLRPAPHARTKIISYSLQVEPTKQFLNWQQDPFGNYQARLVFPEKTNKLRILVDLIAEIQVFNPFDFFLEPDAEEAPFIYSDSLRKELMPYLSASDGSYALANYISQLRKEGILQKARTVDYLVRLNHRVYEDVSYVIRMEPGVQTCTETLEKKSGSCRDSAFLLVQILRHIGLAARFVSGYLIQLKPDEVPIDGPAGPKADFTDLHAWAEVYLPGAGWVGLDPTSGLLAGEGHIPLAAVPEPSSASPVFGYSDPANSKFHFHMEVKRIKESPRVTKPYTDERWEKILKLGKKIDDKLRKNDIRLSIGGEPTFVSDTDRQNSQWNTDALGSEKLSLAEELLGNLRKRFAPGSVVQVTQGKWYPGEPLPRWSLNTFWRRDGEKLWQEEAYLSSVKEKKDADREEELAKAETIGEQICASLGISAKHLIPVFEDGFYYLWKEGQLPKWEKPESPKEDDFSFESLERRRVLSVLEKDFKLKKGFAVPLQYNYILKRWESSEWVYRRERLYLVPGDSPAGLRLPFASIADSFRLSAVLTDIAEPSKLPSYKDILKKVKERSQKEGKFYPSGKELPIRSTLVIEPRAGVLHIFLPPIERLDVWLDLLSSIEDACVRTKLPIVFEGYEPPHDNRLCLFRITPDPGVIEVNLHPSSDFAELEEKTRILYEEAKAIKLSAEKFQIDGRHSGTGGGNHITVGAMTPADSPFLRRPDLLRSLVSYWQHHPSLSYLFSGLFVGPTSQAPRLDEGRDEALYEFELAAKQVDERKKDLPPWLIDRLFRNLLVDLTGNTHRAEISIDKLYPPSGPRLGLVELRAFEMPPHYRMSVVQQLLVLSLLGRLWEKPYKKSPVHWGTELHDRFLLPHYVWNDFKDVLRDLKDHGYAFEEEDFIPFFEFRFPVYGSLKKDEIFLELRLALEPWNVLGEESSSFGTSRSVDSAVERLQVRVEGWTNERFQLACNGVEVPLRPTGKLGEAVAGIRFKAWNLPFTLHPNLPIQNPLVFDIWDTWSNRPVAGCRYYVSHPGGRAYETFPVNSFEAESRRISRFFPDGHSGGSKPAPLKIEKSHAYTLDLRWIDKTI